MSTFEKVRELVLEAKMNEVEPEAITESSHLLDDLKLDSMDVMALVMEIERVFDVEIPDEMLASVKTVGDIVEHLDKQGK